MPRRRATRRPGSRDRAQPAGPPIPSAAARPVPEDADDADTLGDHITEVLQDISFPIPMHRLIDEAGERIVELDDGSVHDLVELLAGATPRVFRSVEEIAEAIQARLDLDARGTSEET